MAETAEVITEAASSGGSVFDSMRIGEIIGVPLQDMLSSITSFLPAIVGALIILVLGWIGAKAVRSIVFKVLTVIKFESISEKSGISAVLEKGEINTTASQMIASLAYWMVMIMVMVMMLNALGLSVATHLLQSLLSYIPRVIVAIFVLVLGLFFGNLVFGIVRTAASNADLPKPDLLGEIAKWSIIIFAVTVAAREIGIAPELVSSTFNILFGAICLAFALAFGLGGRETAAEYLAEIKAKSREK